MARRYHGRRRQADGRLQDLCQAGTQDHPGICLAHSGGGVAMRDVYILGVGQTKRGWFPERGLGSLVAEAGFKATDDAGILMTKVEQVWFGHYHPAASLQFTSGQVVCEALGLSLIHISEPTRLGMISYAVFCLKKKKRTKFQTGS